MQKAKNIFKQFIPPILLSLWRRCFYSYIENSKNIARYGWFGNYSTWEQAKSKCTGYESEIILEKCKNALLKVKIGEAEHERDSVLFNKVEYSYPLLSGLMWVAAQNSGKLNVIDFGGALGSSFFQNRMFLNELHEVKWNIVEQQKFVDTGKKYFEDGRLKFYYSIDECIKESNPNVLLLSGVLQYLENPYRFLESLEKYCFNYILIDRTAFTSDPQDRLTVQKVPPEIYNASYPAWFFNEQKFLGYFSINYTLINSFSSLDKYNVEGAYSKGFILKRKK